MGQIAYGCPVVAARRAFIDNELHKVGGSRQALKYLYGTSWTNIENWINGDAQTHIDDLITQLHKTETGSQKWYEISLRLGRDTKGFRSLDTAFREAKT